VDHARAQAHHVLIEAQQDLRAGLPGNAAIDNAAGKQAWAVVSHHSVIDRR
jgi:hypothetical protein